MKPSSVAFTDHYGRLVGKRFDAEFFLESAAQEGTHGCDYLLTTDMEMEPIPGYKFANWELGYGDFHLVPDLDTFAHSRLAGQNRPGHLRCTGMRKPTSGSMVAPRSILRKQLDTAEDAGYTCFAASEFRVLPF